MSVRVENGVIHLEGICPVEDAEALVSALDRVSGPTVDMAACRQLHGAMVQVLLVFRPSLRGTPEDAFLRDYVIPALERSEGIEPCQANLVGDGLAFATE
jgi:hypothetical protein